MDSATHEQWLVADSLATNAAYFEKQVLMDQLTDPMEIAVAEDGRVFVAERGGAIHRWDPKTRTSKRIGYIPVYMIIEDGLLGLALDPDFQQNGWLYVFYGPADGGDSRLSRFTVENDSIDPASEKILLHVPMQREVCCHAAGSLAFGPDGNLYLSVGDNTDHVDTAGGPIDERPGHEFADGQLTAANTNDLRGKILRIKPEDDGSYSIPKGNLFLGDEAHRPEIYIMGLRNAFRIAIDPQTGWLYFGDVGNGDPPNERGGWGWDEFNQARGPGNYGWPYLTGNNQPYRDFNYATEEIGDPFDPINLINDSPNNSGARALPPAQPAMIWYTFGESEEFPEMGAGGVNPMSGPVYRRADTHTAEALPDYYVGKHFIYDWMRNWVQLIAFDENGDLAAIEPFLSGISFARPMDMEVGPDGALYVIEWGKGFWGSNADAKVVRVVHHGSTYHPQPMEEIQLTVGHAIKVESPANGSFFSYDTPIEFLIRSDDTGYPYEGPLTVRAFAGYDTNTFEVAELSDSSGTVAISRQYAHVPDMHYTDRFAQFQVCYDGGRLGERCIDHKLHPYYKEAEHYDRAEDASRYTYGVQPAAAEFVETALTVIRMKNGGMVQYAPLHLEDIEAIKLRVKTFADVTLTLMLEPTDELAKLDLSIEKGEVLPELPQAQVLDRLRKEGKGHVIERLQRSAYQGWQELTVPIHRLSDFHSWRILRLSVEGQSDGTLLEIDALEFIAKNRETQNAKH